MTSDPSQVDDATLRGCVETGKLAQAELDRRAARKGMLTKAEGEELQALRWSGGAKTQAQWDRYWELRDRCLLYGSESVQPLAFKGLEPRFVGVDYGGAMKAIEWKTDDDR